VVTLLEMTPLRRSVVEGITTQQTNLVFLARQCAGPSRRNHRALLSEVSQLERADARLGGIKGAEVWEFGVRIDHTKLRATIKLVKQLLEMGPPELSNVVKSSRREPE
jgi:hypothetical protein